MKVLRVLYLTKHELAVYRFRAAQLIESFAFSVTPEGMVGFSNYLASTPVTPVLFLVDLAEEEFQLETLPHATFLDRAQLHARHGQRLFRSTPFLHACTVGRLMTDRRDDEVLFSALTKPEHLEPWLALLERTGTPLLAISSIPHVGKWLCRQFGLIQGATLLVSEGEGSGLRQSLYRDGKLRFSRLSATPSSIHPPQARANLICEEIARTQRYLQRLPSHQSEGPLQIAILGGHDQLAALRQCSFSGDPEVHFIELANLNRGARSAQTATRYSNNLYATLFAQHGHNEYARPNHLSHREQYRLQLGIQWAAIVGSVVMVSLTFLALFQAMEYHRMTASITANLVHLPPTTNEAPVEELPLGLSPEQLQQTVETAEGLAALNMQPRMAFSRVGAILRDFPEFVLHRLDWAASTRADFSDLGEGTEGVEFRSSATTEAGLYHGVIVAGEITSFDGDFRTALARLDLLVELMRQAPGAVRVDIIARPLEVGGKIVGSTGSHHDRQVAPFSFRVVFKL